MTQDTRTCTNGHTMTGIGFEECPECDAQWNTMTKPTFDEQSKWVGEVLDADNLRTLIEHARHAERERIVEWANEERTAGSMDEDGHPQDWCIDYDDLIDYLTAKDNQN